MEQICCGLGLPCHTYIVRLEGKRELNENKVREVRGKGGVLLCIWNMIDEFQFSPSSFIKLNQSLNLYDKTQMFGYE